MTCLTCLHWSPQRTTKEWTKLGFAQCALGPAWTVRSLSHTCAKCQPCEAGLAAKRLEWAQKRATARAALLCATE
jgi:hypothetical protein